MLDSAQLLTLALVLRSGSFEGAARHLGVTQSAVSQRIRALEERVGAPLIIRGQPCTATETGARLARHAEDVALLESRLGLPAAAAPQVRIAVNADSLATWVLPALARTAPMLFDLVVDDQNHSADWLRRGAVSAAITGHAAAPQGCDSTPLGAMRYVATASADYVARHFPDGVSAEALARAPALTYNSKDSLQRDWIRLATGAELAPPTHLLPSSTAFVEAACLGLGWGMNPELLVAPHLASGRLVRLGPDLDQPLYWQVSRLTGAALSDLTRHLRSAARAQLVPPGGSEGIG